MLRLILENRKIFLEIAEVEVGRGREREREMV